MRIDGLVLTFLLNALWQVPVAVAAALLGDRLLRRSPARYRHALWLGALAAVVLLPASSLLPQLPWRSAPVPEALPIHTLDAVQAPATAGPVRSRSARLPEIPEIPGSLAWPVILLYGLSIAAHAVRLGRAWRWTDRLARGAEPAGMPERSAEIAARCRTVLGLERVEILSSSEVDGPVTLGAVRPAILLPPGFLDRSTDDQLTAALAHEMAHIRRRDYALNLLGEAALLPVAFHPALRWLRRRLAETREMACDEAAVERLIGARAYARSLLSLASSLAGFSRPATTTLGALDADILEVRMRRLTDPDPRPGARRARAALAVASLVLALAGVTAAGLSLEAATPTSAGGGDLEPFVGSWLAESALNPGEKPLRWVEMEIREGNGPDIDLTFFKNRRQEDGSTLTDPVKVEVSDARLTGRTLRFRVRGGFQYGPGPREIVELDQVFELVGKDEATLRQTWSSLEGRKDVPPPPPAPTILRRVG